MKSSSDKSLTSESLVLIGHIRGPRGLKGQLRFFINDPSSSIFSQQFTIWIGTEAQSAKPFTFVKGSRAPGGDYIATLKEVATRELAETFKGQHIFVRASQLVSTPGETIYLRELLTFQVFDESQLIGTVTGFTSNGAQDIMEIRLEVGPGNCLIPLVKDFIVTIDFEKKQIHLRLPPGLLEATHAL